MSPALAVVLEIGLWWAAVVKLLHLRRSPEDRPLRAVTGLCLCLALGSAAALPGVHQAVEDAVPGLSRLLLNLFTVTATYFLTAFYGHSVGSSVRGPLAGLLAAQAVMLGSWLAAPEFVREGPAALENLDEPSSAVFTVAALGYMGFGLGQAFRWSVVHARAAHRVRLRTSLRIVSVALACLLTACLTKAGVALAVGLFAGLEPDDPLPVGLSLGYASLVLVGTVLVVTGFCYPAVASLPARIRRSRERRALYLRLGPLWLRMRAAFPHLVLPSGVPGFAGGWLPWTYRAYYRRVIEIRDTIDQLAPYYDPEVVARARSAEFGGDHEIRVCALLMADALERRAQDRPVEEPFVLPPLGGEDLDSDARWLARLADRLDQGSSVSPRTSSIRST